MEELFFQSKSVWNSNDVSGLHWAQFSCWWLPEDPWGTSKTIGSSTLVKWPNRVVFALFTHPYGKWWHSMGLSGRVGFSEEHFAVEFDVDRLTSWDTRTWQVCHVMTKDSTCSFCLGSIYVSDMNWLKLWRPSIKVVGQQQSWVHRMLEYDSMTW